MIDHRSVTASGLNFHVATAGPEDGPLVILLHGFPELWFGWRHQIDFLADAGFCVWAPDQRGYNLSDKPPGAEAYAIDYLAADVVGLILAAGRERAILVGHDWGGAVVWHLAATMPERVERAVILNVPHPVVMLRHLKSNLRQVLRSWYMIFFQVPWLPDWWLGFNRGWPLARTLRRTSRPGTFSADDLAHYREAWSQPGAITAMLNWYRAAMRFSRRQAVGSRIHVPTLLIWGARDAFIGRETAQPSIDLCQNGRLEFIENATHWVQHEEASRVNELILQFLGGAYILLGRPEKALPVFQEQFRTTKNPSPGILAALLADQLSDEKTRGELLAEVIAEGPTFKERGKPRVEVLQLAFWLVDGLKEGGKGDHDLAPIDKLLADAEESDRLICQHLLGRYLSQHGARDRAIEYWKRVMASSQLTNWHRSLAGNALTELGLGPKDFQQELLSRPKETKRGDDKGE
ncbi:MAG TPA: alpha/beta hydrolase [Pirellulales bacterium]|jgi:pimeloyl-ACP methyl ester carboxylesterase|nr:alpha/beta hydrolase [Pirellulales bacterium]